MPEYIDEVDADFLAFYRIDLRDPDTYLSAETFFKRAFRLFSFRGAMREALQLEMDRAEKRGQPVSAEPARTAPAAPVDSEKTLWVSPEEMTNLFPDLF